MTRAMTVAATAARPAAAMPVAPGRGGVAPATGATIGPVRHWGTVRGLRCSTRRHGSSAIAASVASPGPAAPGRAPAAANRMRLAPSVTIPPSGTTVGPATVTPSIRHGTRPVSWRNDTVPSTATSRTPWWASSSGSTIRTAARGDRPTTWRPGARSTTTPAAGPASHVATTTGSAAARRRAGGPDVAAAADPGTTDRLVPRDRSSVDLEVAGKAEAEGVGELADPIVGRARGDGDPRAGGSGQLEGGDERGRHASMGAPTRPKGNADRPLLTREPVTRGCESLRPCRRGVR